FFSCIMRERNSLDYYLPACLGGRQAGSEDLFGTIFVIFPWQNKTREDALHPCRDEHEDLASIFDQQDQAWAELAVKDANSSHVWLGLHDTWTLDFWFWIEDHNLKYKHWATDGGNEIECDTSAAMSKDEDNHWYDGLISSVERKGIEGFVFVLALMIDASFPADESRQ
uniref:C-type lectin domain-containing protein n=1 Tax=Echeneis naucrates TaxID=173247 RepID=A0A665TLC5_ECHNA